MMPGMTEIALDTPAVPPSPLESARTPAEPPKPVVVEPAPEPVEPAAEVEPEVPSVDPEQVKAEEWLAAETEWKTRFDPDWGGRRVDFHGDYLAVNTPTDSAYAAVSLVSSKYVSDEEKTDLLGGFVYLHLARQSYSQFMSRMMSPTNDYGDSAFSDFAAAIAKKKEDDAEKKDDAADEG